MKQIFLKCQKDIRNFMVMLLFVDGVTFMTNYRGWVRSYNTTMLALSYEYGFTSRSLLGTLYHLLDRIIPVDMMQYDKVRIFADIITLLFILYIVYFSYYVLKKNPVGTEKNVIRIQEYLLIGFNVATVATFSYAYNFLRVDFAMLWMSLLAFMSLMNEKTEWMSIIFAALGVMFHQGYVLMYFNTVLIIQFYYMMTRKKWKNVFLFFGTFGVGSALFLWFELFSRTNGEEIFDRVLNEATNLSYNGIYHSTLLYHEVLGIDVSGAETEYVYMNHLQLIMYLAIMLPVIITMLKVFVNMIMRAEDIWGKLKYLAVAMGSLTILPDIMLKIDYGRWVMSVVAYYLLIMIFLLIIQDEIFIDEAKKVYYKAKTSPWVIVYALILVISVPFMDVDIDMVVKNPQRWMWIKGVLFY